MGLGTEVISLIGNDPITIYSGKNHYRPGYQARQRKACRAPKPLALPLPKRKDPGSPRCRDPYPFLGKDTAVGTR
jgi:hypothetical protein